MYFEFLGNQIPLYGILFFAGIFASAAVALIICKKSKISKFDIVSSGIYTMIGAIVGSKLLFILASWESIVAYKIEYDVPISDLLISLIKGGFVFYGGLIGGLLGLIIYTWQFKMKFSEFADIYAAVIPLGHAIGRVGCFFGGCCYGIPYNGLFSYTYTTETGGAPVGVPLLPIQLIEAAALLLLFFALLIIFIKTDKKYLCVITYALSYSIIRFILEFFRGDAVRGKFLFLSTSQWISVLIVVFILGYFFYAKSKAGARRANIIEKSAT
ncbi:MAG: prolipoprotein diacylglyceryl transferase [Ruminococcaceae bacterium]|nr:prolipoprotein diacylglyceryl transferase [Oscillospiraceae bacterium]